MAPSGVWKSISQVITKKIITGLNSLHFNDFISPVFDSIEKIYQTLKSLFHLISKHLEFCQKYFTSKRRIFNYFLSVWKSDETSLVFFMTMLGIGFRAVFKPKPKQLQWPITTNVSNKTTQWELEANTRNPRQARENARDQVTIGFGFTFWFYLIGWEGGANL